MQVAKHVMTIWLSCWLADRKIYCSGGVMWSALIKLILKCAVIRWFSLTIYFVIRIDSHFCSSIMFAFYEIFFILDLINIILSSRASLSFLAFRRSMKLFAHIAYLLKFIHQNMLSDLIALDCIFFFATVFDVVLITLNCFVDGLCMTMH